MENRGAFMTISLAQETAVKSRADGAATMAGLVYGLYAFGFVTGITALMGLAIAIACKKHARGIAASHFAHQVDIVWRSVMLLGTAFILYLAIGIAGALTMGAALVLDLIPLAIAVFWLVWTVASLVKGVHALLRGEPVPYSARTEAS